MENIYLKNILKEIDHTFKKIPDSSVIEMINYLAGFERIFITGAGRSGLLMKTFAIRLMQMGFKVHVPGEVSTPAIKSGDLLLIGSGSGETASLKIFAQKAKKIGAKIAIITMSADSSIAKLADAVIVIPAKSSKTEHESYSNSFQPMCNLFEQSLLILLDLISILMMDYKKIDKKILYENHANLE